MKVTGNQDDKKRMPLDFVHGYADTRTHAQVEQDAWMDGLKVGIIGGLAIGIAMILFVWLIAPIPLFLFG